MESSKQEKPQPKLPKIKAFKTIQKNFAAVGISPSLITQSQPLDGKISIIFLTICSLLTLICVDIFNDAETFSEFTQSIYIASVLVLILFVLMVLIFKADDLFKFIAGCDTIINEREWRILNRYHMGGGQQNCLLKISKLSYLCIF